MTQQHQRRLPVQAAWLLLLLLQLTVLPGRHAIGKSHDYEEAAAQTPSPENSSRRRSSSKSFGHIIVLRHDPVVSYSGGGQAGMAATAQAASLGGKLDVTAAAVTAYAAFLQTASVSVASRASIAPASIIYNYQFAAAGFAVAQLLTQQQLDALRRDPEVLSVTVNKVFSVRTMTTPRFLGLAGTGRNGRGGVWDRLGARYGGPARAGDGVVIGVLDTGIWPEHPSFSDRQDLSSNGTGAFAYTPLDRQLYRGRCVAGEQFRPSQCSRKLVGCQHFARSFGARGGVKALYPEELESCRGVASHGTHVAATAAGNYGVRFQGSVLSGMAPRARIAAYKVCWGQEDGSCPQADILAALDKAVADGVDVINMSLGSGGSTEFPDMLAAALMQVARAGIFVAASAGNDGPKDGSIENGAPWVTTVAASSHNRAFRATVVLGSGSKSGAAGAGTLTLTGAGFYSGSLAVSPVVLAQQAAAAGAKAARAEQCYAGTLDAALVRGRVVVCDRGGNGRAEKAAAVAAAGGVAMLLLNTPSDADWVAAQPYAVPSVHLLAAFRDRVRAFVTAAGAAATARILPVVRFDNATAPRVTAFSSRGPEPASGGAVLKPDLTAPGLDVVAAASSSDGTAVRDAAGNAFVVYSGTSMSSPHIAGLAALVRQARPSWSPMAIKSAMMTTAYRSTKTGKTGHPIGGNPFAFGAGHVNPEKMLNPGLVFDSGFADWSKFACAAAKPVNVDLPASVKNICGSCVGDAASSQTCTSAADFNGPSISLPSIVAGSTKVVTRRVTNVLNVTAIFSAVELQGGSGSAALSVSSITPRAFTLAPGQSQQIQIAVQIAGATLGGGWVFSSAALQSREQGTYTRIPIAAKASFFEAPTQIKPATVAAAFTFPVLTGWQGTLDIQNLGLAAPVILEGSMLSSSRDGNAHNISIPADTSFFRISMFARDLQPAACCDLDVRLLQGLNVIGSSWTPGTSDEQISVTSPKPGMYTVRVLGGYDAAPRRVRYFVYVWMLQGSSSSSSSSDSTPGLPVHAGDGGEQIATSSDASNPVSSGAASVDAASGDTDAAGSSNSSSLDGGSTLQQQGQGAAAAAVAVAGVSMKVAPVGLTAVRPGKALDLQLKFKGLQLGGVPPKRYFGMIGYAKGQQQLGYTQVDIA